MIANGSSATGCTGSTGWPPSMWQTGFEQYMRSRVGPSMPGPYYNIL